MPHRGGFVLVRWNDNFHNSRARFEFEGKPIVFWRTKTSWYRGEKSYEEHGNVVDVTVAMDLIAKLRSPGPHKLRPKVQPGFGALDALLDPRSYATNEWIFAAGSSADGVVYNSSVSTATRVDIEIDIAARTGRYFETDDYSD